MADYLQPLLDWVTLHPVWSGLIVFLIAMGESLAMVGLIIPGVVLMFGVGALISTGNLEFWPVFWWAVAGAFCGDALSFLLGYRFRDRLENARPFRRRPAMLTQGREFFGRYGGRSIVLGRFVGPMRAVVPVVAGMMRMPVGRFLVIDALSALAWAPAYLFPGMVFGASLELAAEVATRLVVLLLMLLATLWFTFWFVRRMFRLLQPHANQWSRWLLDWSQVHPRLGNLGAALADPNHPESRGLAVLATLLVLTMWLFVAILGGVLQGTPFVDLDQATQQLMQSLRTPLGDHLMVQFTQLADLEIVLAVTVSVLVYLLWKRRAKEAVHWLAAVAFGLLAGLALKYALRIPRPTPLIEGLGPYAFPSNHVLRAAVLYGFIAVLVARAVQLRWRWLPYATAGLVILPVAASRVYLGAHWFSDVVGALALGLAWVALLGIAYYRHTPLQEHWRGLAATTLVTLGLAGLWHASASHETDVRRFTPSREIAEIQAADWWAADWQTLPAFRHDLRRLDNQPLTIQWAGPLDPLASHLQDRGWRRADPLRGRDLLRLLAPGDDVERLPLLPQVHNERHEALALIKPLSRERRLVLRLWPADVQLNPGGEALWVGNVSYQRAGGGEWFSYPETEDDFEQPLAALRADLTGLDTRDIERIGPLGGALPLILGRTSSPVPINLP